MKQTYTTTRFIAKLLVFLSLSFFINSLRSSAQIVFENKMPDNSEFSSIKTQIGGLIVLNGFFDVKGGLNDQPSFNLSQIDVFKLNTYSTFNMHMRLSILRMVNEFRLKNGDVITTKVEGDFNGTKSFETMPAFRLRHINVRYKGWLVGQDWSTFGDIGASVSTLDADGPSIGLGFRKPVIRYTFNYKNPLKFDLALEQPLIDYRLPKYNDDDSVQVKQVTPYFPEIVGAVEYTFGPYSSHVRFASVLRKISYINISEHTKHTTSWGASLSSKLNVSETISFMMQGNVGRGIGIYTSSFAASGYDGFVTNNKLKTIPAFGGFAAVEIKYTKNSPFTSTFALGYSRFTIDALNNIEIAKNGYYGDTYNSIKKYYDKSYHKLDINIPYASANLLYRMFENLTFGAEVNWGGKTLVSKSSDKDKKDQIDSKKAFRVTFGMLYKL